VAPAAPPQPAGAAPPATAGPDPHVGAAFALGWQMAELYEPAPAPHDGAPAAAARGLPGLGQLPPGQRRALGLAQVQVALARLRRSIEAAELETPDLDAARRALDGSAAAADPREAIARLHTQLLLVLTAVDYRLGKAYGLGRALADTTRGPRDLGALRRELDPHRVATLAAWLSDLGSALPPHAGQVVRSSLQAWSQWAAGAGDGDVHPATWRLLRRQGELWRALLSGEKRATDMLSPVNYLDAARRQLGQVRALVAGFLRRFPLLVALIVALFAAGVVLMLTLDDSGGIAAGAGAILASAGLSWKGIGRGLETLLAKVERPLWEAELSAAVADATCLVPGRASAANRRHRELALAQADGARR
jgi:hypothetical protein